MYKFSRNLFYKLNPRLRFLLFYLRHPFRLFYLLKAKLFLATSNRKIIYIVSFPKSGSTLLENLIEFSNKFIIPPFVGDFNFNLKHELSENSYDYLFHDINLLIKNHINPSIGNVKILRKYGIKRIVVMVRDPRSMVVSNIKYVLKKSLWNRGYELYDGFEKKTPSEQLSFTELHFHSKFTDWHDGWRNLNNEFKLLFISYEQLLSNPAKLLKKIYSFYDLNIDDIEIENAIANVLFCESNKSKRLSRSTYLPDDLDHEILSYRNREKTVFSNYIKKYKDEYVWE